MPKLSFRHLKQGNQECHRKYVFVPAGKQLTMLLLSVNILIQKPAGTKTYERTSSHEKSYIDNHCYHITTKFAKYQRKLRTTSYVVFVT